MTELIGIVTVVYNGESVLTEFFESLEKQTYRNFILYVVDNKSPDNALPLVKELSKKTTFQTHIIENECNFGVAKGNNIGIRKALEDGCDYVLLSNNDVTLENDTIESLKTGLERHQTGMAVPKIHIHGTNLIWAAGGYFNKKSGLNIHFGYRNQDIGQYNKELSVTFAATCFMLIRKNMFEKVGMMDEHYFVYWDDTDFVYRAIKNNESLWYIPSSLVHHKEGTSTGVLSDFSINYLYRNFIYFALKNYPRPYAWWVIFYNIAYHCLKISFQWPFRKWILGIKAYKEGFALYHDYGK